MNDLVKQIDRWLAQQGADAMVYSPSCQLLRLARDEIVALRTNNEATKRMSYDMVQARAEALEEAAQACIKLFDELPDSFTEAIAECVNTVRMLK